MDENKLYAEYCYYKYSQYAHLATALFSLGAFLYLLHAGGYPWIMLAPFALSGFHSVTTRSTVKRLERLPEVYNEIARRTHEKSKGS